MDSKETIRLIKKARKNDHEAFGRLVSRHMEQVYRLAFRILGNRTDAEDAVQDSWIKVWKNLREFREQSSFQTWVYRIVTYTCLDYLKKGMIRLDKFRDNGDRLDQNPGNAPDPESMMVANEELRLLWRITETLPPKQKIVFILRDLEGRSPSEVAEMDKETLKSHLWHARKTVRVRMEKMKTEEERYYEVRRN